MKCPRGNSQDRPYSRPLKAQKCKGVHHIQNIVSVQSNITIKSTEMCLEKSPDIWLVLNNPWVKEETKKRIRKYLE